MVSVRALSRARARVCVCRGYASMHAHRRRRMRVALRPSRLVGPMSLTARGVRCCSIWFSIGMGETVGPDGEIVQGWVRNSDGKGWSDEDLQKGCETDHGCAIGYGSRYVASMFTSFNLDYAFLDEEYGFLLMSILVTGFIYGALAGVISTLLMGLAAGDQEFTAKLQSLKAWMGARGLNKQDRSKILAYYVRSRPLPCHFHVAHCPPTQPTSRVISRVYMSARFPPARAVAMRADVPTVAMR
jgi:hypothetical protein